MQILCYFTIHKYDATNTTQNESKATQQLGVNTNEISHFWEDNLLSSFLFFLDQIKRERCFEIAIAPKSRQFFFQRKFEVEKRDYTKEFGREIPGLVDKNLKLLILSNQMFVQWTLNCNFRTKFKLFLNFPP